MKQRILVHPIDQASTGPYNPTGLPLNTEALSNARLLMRRQIGTLSDLPEELRNTVANIYHELALMELEMSLAKSSDSWTPTPRPGEDALGTLKRWNNERAHVLSWIDTMPEVIDALRDLIKRGEIDRFQSAVSAVLAGMKYGIHGATEKSILRLKVEMKFRSSFLKEIPQLWRHFE